MHRFTQNIRYDVGRHLALGSATATTYTGTSADMRKYNNFVGIVSGVAAAGTNDIGALVCYIAESTDSTTYSANYLATATAASATGGLCFGTVVECRAEQMTDTYRYLRVVVAPAAGTANSIAIQNLRFNARFPQTSLPA